MESNSTSNTVRMHIAMLVVRLIGVGRRQRLPR